MPLSPDILLCLRNGIRIPKAIWRPCVIPGVEGAIKRYPHNRSIWKRPRPGKAGRKNLKRRIRATDGRRLTRRRAGDITRQCIGMLIAGSAGMPFAPFHGHLGMSLQQRVELLPDFPVGDRSSAGTLVRRDPLPAVIAPDRPISVATFNDMSGVRPERDCARWRLGGDPGHCVEDSEDLETIVRCANRLARGGMDLVAIFMNDERPSSGSGGIVEGAVGKDVKRIGHERVCSTEMEAAKGTAIAKGFFRSDATSHSAPSGRGATTKAERAAQATLS